MPYKIYQKENYLLIVDTITGKIIEGTSSRFEFVRNLESDTVYNLLKDRQSIKSFSLNELQKENGTPYTESEWETFYTSLYRPSSVAISPRPNTTGSNGTTPYKLISLGTTNANVVKNTGGNLYSIVAIGLTSTVRYLKLYNKGTVPVVGTDIPVMTIPIPANTQGAGIAIPFSMGVNFPLGIAIAITAGPADNDVTVIGAGDVIINLTFA